MNHSKQLMSKIVSSDYITEYGVFDINGKCIEGVKKTCNIMNMKPNYIKYPIKIEKGIFDKNEYLIEGIKKTTYPNGVININTYLAYNLVKSVIYKVNGTTINNLWMKPQIISAENLATNSAENLATNSAENLANQAFLKLKFKKRKIDQYNNLDQKFSKIKFKKNKTCTN